MKKINFKKLTQQTFSGYGCFANMLKPEGFKIGEGGLEFYRDMIKLSLGNEAGVSFSIAKAMNTNKKVVISLIEYHSKCGEAILPLDGDVIISIAPATPPGDTPVDRIEAFLVPVGTMVVLNPGVWHGAPLLYKCQSANILIGLPERTYANDSVVFEIPEKDCIEIEL